MPAFYFRCLPNVHLLYPDKFSKEVKAFIEDQLIEFSENKLWFDDYVGSGPFSLKECAKMLNTKQFHSKLFCLASTVLLNKVMRLRFFIHYLKGNLSLKLSKIRGKTPESTQSLGRLHSF